jgi:cytochrome P450
MLPFFVVARIVYGRLSPGVEEKLRVLAPEREELFRHVIFGGITRFDCSQYLPTKANRELADFKAKWKSLNATAAREARTQKPMPPIVGMYKAVQLGQIAEDELLQTLDEVLFANLDVTMGGLSWNVVFLAAYQHTQAKFRKEVQEQEAPNSHLEEPLSADLKSSSTFLHALILESSRHRPLTTFPASQTAPTARLVDGFEIPAGTSFTIDSTH